MLLYDHYCNFHKYLFNMLYVICILYVLQIAEENKFKSNQIKQAPIAFFNPILYENA